MANSADLLEDFSDDIFDGFLGFDFDFTGTILSPDLASKYFTLPICVCVIECLDFPLWHQHPLSGISLDTIPVTTSSESPHVFG